jgi:hypothetical protein
MSRWVHRQAILLLGACLISSCRQSPGAFNPTRSAELLSAAFGEMGSVSRELQLLRSDLHDIRVASTTVGSFPWAGWRIEPASKLVLTTPDDKHVEFTFQEPLTNFNDFDDFGDIVIKNFVQDPKAHSVKLRIGARVSRAEPPDEGVRTRLRVPLEAAEQRLNALEKRLVQLQQRIDRASDFLPPVAPSSKKPA